jgi:aldose 1-epimerase
MRVPRIRRLAMMRPATLSLHGALSPWWIEIAPSCGGAWIALRHRHRGQWRDVGRPADAVALHGGDCLGLTAWPLVPYSNRVPRGRVRAAVAPPEVRLSPTDERFSMPIHGSGWKRPWEVTDQSDQHCVMQLTAPATDWPWAFQATQSVILEDDLLRISLVLRNDSKLDMPSGIGWHPYFVRTPQATLTMALAWRDEPVDLDAPGPYRRNALQHPWNPPAAVTLASLAPLDHCFGGWDGRATLQWPEWRLAMDLIAVGALARYSVIFCPQETEFVCIEPVSHSNAALSLPPEMALQEGIVQLRPGQCIQGEITLRLREIPEHTA